tara:strand:- start:1459 stop:1893 length:435 start_codon:yes stop_codon:yes gene_type:complete
MNSIIEKEHIEKYTKHLIKLAAFVNKINYNIWDIYWQHAKDIQCSFIDYDTSPYNITELLIKNKVKYFWENEWLLWHPENYLFVKLLCELICTLQQYILVLDIDYNIITIIKDLPRSHANHTEDIQFESTINRIKKKALKHICQ